MKRLKEVSYRTLCLTIYLIRINFLGFLLLAGLACLAYLLVQSSLFNGMWTDFLVFFAISGVMSLLIFGTVIGLAVLMKLGLRRKGWVGTTTYLLSVVLFLSIIVVLELVPLKFTLRQDTWSGMLRYRVLIPLMFLVALSRITLSRYPALPEKLGRAIRQIKRSQPKDIRIVLNNEQ